MCKSIDDYLQRLREAMSGCDPALIQDAVSDAEEHLSLAISAPRSDGETDSGPVSLAEAIDGYGPPEETSAAYRKLEQRFFPPPALKTGKRPGSGAFGFFSVFSDPRAWSSALFLILSITGIITGIWAVVGLALSVFTPLALVYLPSIRILALLEGRMVEALLGTRMPRRPRFDTPATWWSRLRRLLTDPVTWKSILYFILKLPAGLLSFTLMTSLSAVALKAALYPILGPILGRPLITLDSGPVFVPIWIVPLIFAGGLLLLAFALHISRLIGRAQGRFAKFMLVHRQGG